MSQPEGSLPVPESSSSQTDSASQAIDEEKDDKEPVAQTDSEKTAADQLPAEEKIRNQNQIRNQRLSLIPNPFPSLLRNRHRNLPRILSRPSRQFPHLMWKAMSRWQNPMGSP